MPSREVMSPEKRLGRMTLFSLTAILGESTDNLATIRLSDAPMAFDQASAALGQIPKPLRCTAELEGRELVLAVRSLDPKLDGERPLYMATVLPELNRQYLAEKGSIPWSERRVQLRGVGEELIVSAQDFVDWLRDYWLAQVSMIFTPVSDAEPESIIVEVFFPPLSQEVATAQMTTIA